MLIKEKILTSHQEIGVDLHARSGSGGWRSHRTGLGMHAAGAERRRGGGSACGQHRGGPAGGTGGARGGAAAGSCSGAVAAGIPPDACRAAHVAAPARGSQVAAG